MNTNDAVEAHFRRSCETLDRAPLWESASGLPATAAWAARLSFVASSAIRPVFIQPSFDLGLATQVQRLALNGQYRTVFAMPLSSSRSAAKTIHPCSANSPWRK